MTGGKGGRVRRKVGRPRGASGHRSFPGQRPAPATFAAIRSRTEFQDLTRVSAPFSGRSRPHHLVDAGHHEAGHERIGGRRPRPVAGRRRARGRRRPGACPPASCSPCTAPLRRSSCRYPTELGPARSRPQRGQKRSRCRHPRDILPATELREDVARRKHEQTTVGPHRQRQLDRLDATITRDNLFDHDWQNSSGRAAAAATIRRGSARTRAAASKWGVSPGAARSRRGSRQPCRRAARPPRDSGLAVGRAVSSEPGGVSPGGGRSDPGPQSHARSR